MALHKEFELMMGTGRVLDCHESTYINGMNTALVGAQEGSSGAAD